MTKEIKNKKAKPAGRRGVSFIEILVTMFIFVLIMTSSIAAFSTFFKARKTTREIQRGLEESRAALETMAKNIRMSSKIPEASDGQTISMFNNSQKICIVYQFNGGKLRSKFVEPTLVPPLSGQPDPGSCAANIAAAPPLTLDDNLINEGTVTGWFDITETVPSTSAANGVIGKATIKINMTSGSTISHIQTTVSFRDYEGELY